MYCSYSDRRTRSGFTLVELLVVIAIIGVLVALLLPAVQAAREAARRMQCGNNLKQIGLGFQLHHDSFGALPNGGAGKDPVRVFKNGAPAVLTEQSLNWAYQILPYLEQQALYQEPNDDVLKRTPVKTYFCPTRRPPQVWNCSQTDGGGGPFVMRAQMDYVACRGNSNTGANGAVARSFTVNSSGVKVLDPTVRFQNITDGLSNTLLAGDRCMDPKHYLTPGVVESDWESCGYTSGFYGSIQTHLTLSGANPPLKDQRANGVSSVSVLIYNSFGSGHPGGLNALVCDGSVRTVSYNVAGGLFLDFARRDDGNSFSVSSLD